MRRISFEQVNGIKVPLVSNESGTPRARGSDVVVKVSASSINGSDIGLLRSTGLLSLLTSSSRPGFDIAGQIIACGNAVTAFEVGDRVMGLLDHRGGGQSEYLAVPQRRLTLIPPGLSDIAAAALPLAALTALQAIRGRARLQTNIDKKVLIIGAAGGIGSFAVQLAKISGAQVVAVAGGDRSAYLRSLGADRVVDRDEMTAVLVTEQFDIIFDVPSMLRFADVRSALSDGGVLVSTRPISSDTVRMLRPTLPSGRDEKRFSAVATSPSSQDLMYLARLVLDGRVRIPVDRTFPFLEATAAYAHAGSGEVRGKVVLTF